MQNRESGFTPSLRLIKLQRHGIHAIPEPGRSRAVIEDVAQVAAAAAANDFIALHAVTRVGGDGHFVRCDRLEETRPAGTGFEFGVGAEELLVARGTEIGTRLV